MNRLMFFTASMIFLAATGGCYVMPAGPLTGAQTADQIARSVALTSGRDIWPRVTTVSFTYVVREGNDIKISRSHLWNTRTGTDTITVAGKTSLIDVKNPIADDPADAELQKAFAEDTQWILTPFRLFAPGVHREYLGTRDISGKSYQVLHLYFDPNKASTPSAGDAYDLYVDPYTNLIAYSDYLPAEITPTQDFTRATWEDYRHPNGFTLATMHRMAGKSIAIENLSFVTE